VSTNAQGVDRIFAEETNRLTAERLPIGAVAFALVFGAAWVFEHAAHPERDAVFAVIYAAELLTVGAAVLLIRQPGWRRHSRRIAVATAVALLGWICAYHVAVRGEAEILASALIYLATGTMVLFPWGWQGQLCVALGTVLVFGVAVALGERLATPLAINLLGLGTVSALTVSGAAFLSRHRWRFLWQAAQLRAANAALEDANQTKNQFLASVSHELRTPLNIIVGYTDLLLEGHFGTLAPEVSDTLDRIARNGRSLVYLISDLLDLARIEAGRLTVRLAPVRLAPMFEEMSRFVEPRLRSVDVRFRTEVPDSLAVVADRHRLEQILVNLLSNALKFTERGEIAIRAGEPVSSTVAIEVHDTGVGIEAGELPRLFEPFSQGANGRKAGGVGIGLSLSARLAAAMGGTLSVTSQVGHGSTFVLQLPVATE